VNGTRNYEGRLTGLTNGQASISTQILQPPGPARFSAFFLYLLNAAKFLTYSSARIAFIHPGALECRDPFRNVKLNFPIEVLLQPLPPQ
jgi:hypothetical protein